MEMINVSGYVAQEKLAIAEVRPGIPSGQALGGGCPTAAQAQGTSECTLSTGHLEVGVQSTVILLLELPFQETDRINT